MGERRARVRGVRISDSRSFALATDKLGNGGFALASNESVLQDATFRRGRGGAYTREYDAR